MLKFSKPKTRKTLKSKKRCNPRDLDATFSLEEYEKIHSLLIKEGWKQQKDMMDVYIRDNVVISMEYNAFLKNASGLIMIFSEEDIKEIKASGKKLMETSTPPMNTYPLSKKGLKYFDEDIKSFQQSFKTFKKIVEL